MAKPPRSQLELELVRHERRTDSRRVMAQLRHDAERIAEHFRLRYRSIRAERDGVTEHFGVCYSTGEIRIRLRHAVTGRLLRYSSLVDTLCHELAHLRHFDHSERFEAFFRELLEWCRTQGIYRPRVLAPASRTGTGAGAAARHEPMRDAARGDTRPGLPAELQLPLFGGPRLRHAIAGRKRDDERAT